MKIPEIVENFLKEKGIFELFVYDENRFWYRSINDSISLGFSNSGNGVMYIKFDDNSEFRILLKTDPVTNNTILVDRSKDIYHSLGLFALGLFALKDFLNDEINLKILRAFDLTCISFNIF